MGSRTHHAPSLRTGSASQRADDVSVIAHRTRETRVVHVASYFRLHLGEPVTIVSLKTLDDQGQPKLLALVIRAHRR